MFVILVSGFNDRCKGWSLHFYLREGSYTGSKHEYVPPPVSLSLFVPPSCLSILHSCVVQTDVRG